MNPSNYIHIISLINQGQTQGLPTHTTNHNGCWIPPNKPNKEGYVQVGRRLVGRRLIVWLHTLSYFLHNGFDGANEHSQVCHKEICNGLRACFNPDHLYLGDAKSNALDRVAYGISYGVRGEAHTNSKLTEADVRKIRDMLNAGFKQTSIAQAFNVSQRLISHIKHRKRWHHI